MAEYRMNNSTSNMRSAQVQNENKDIKEVLCNIDEILLFHVKFNDKSMKSCHANGYNGFKRMHRYNTRCFENWHLELENEAYDKFRIELPDVELDSVKNTWGASLIDHLKQWDMQLNNDITELAMLNNEYRMYAGVGNCIVEKALHKMTRNHEKTGRWIKRFTETNSAHDWHETDDFLHERYKKKEEEHKTE